MITPSIHTETITADYDGNGFDDTITVEFSNTGKEAAVSAYVKLDNGTTRHIDDAFVPQQDIGDGQADMTFKAGNDTYSVYAEWSGVNIEKNIQ